MTDNSQNKKERKAIIIGAGPAGVTAAFELLNRTAIKPVIFDKNDRPGGISRTIAFGKNFIDIGPHRFFTKNKQILQWWNNVLPVEKIPEGIIIADNTPFEFQSSTIDPETSDEVFLIRRRFTSIYYNSSFVCYPIKLNIKTLRSLGFFTSLKAVLSFLSSNPFRRNENNLEDFFINRFGKVLYRIFFENYTEKIWGKHPSEMASDWGAQRVKKISFSSVINDYLLSTLLFTILRGHKRKIQNHVEEYFFYPKYGSGQMWETAILKIKQMGGEISYCQTVKSINIENNRVVSVLVGDNQEPQCCDFLFSSMPLDELLKSIKGIKIPDNIMEIANGLLFRNHITAVLLLDKLEIKRKGKKNSSNKNIQEQWIYVQDNNIKAGRVFFMHNFSTYTIEHKDKFLIGIEYFCNDEDPVWHSTEESFIQMAVAEVEKMGIIKHQDILHAFRIKERKAYPSYYGHYNSLPLLTDFLDKIENLYCIGRNGQHRYNNMDHSMLTAIEAVNHLNAGIKRNKSDIWNVNLDKEYHEQ